MLPAVGPSSPKGAAIAAFAAGAFLLAACSGGGTSTSTQAGQSSPPTAAPSPSASSLSQNFGNYGPCPEITIPGVAGPTGCLTAIEADLDGDGSPDRFEVFARLGANDMPRSWRVRAVLSSGSTPQEAIPTGPAAGGVRGVYPGVIGAADANGDGRPEMFVKLAGILYHVAGQHIVGIFDVDGGRIVPVQIRGQGRLEFITGGALSFGQGASCTTLDGRPAFDLYRVRKSTTQVWQIRTAAYLWQGDELVPGKVSYRSKPVKPEAFDPSIAALFHLRCGDIEVI
jgi:hypothetical protein